MKITFLRIFTTNFAQQLKFYEEVLQLPINKVSDAVFQVKVGFSILEFEERTGATPYHIAFHIPARQEQDALNWLKKKIGILEDDGHEIVDFPAWNAKSIYFYDADKNILEFISWRDLYPLVKKVFSAEGILGISEIGLATRNVREKYDFLNDNLGLQKYSGDYERFCATGDDDGLFIIINKDRKNWIPTGDKAYASDFDIKIAIENDIFGVSYQNETLELL